MKKEDLIFGVYQKNGVLFCGYDAADLWHRSGWYWHEENRYKEMSYNEAVARFGLNDVEQAIERMHGGKRK